MKEMLFNLALLGIAMSTNIALGLYFNIGKLKIKFSKKKLINGLVKSVIIAYSSIALTFIFEQKPELLQSVGADPVLLINSAIVIYVALSIKTFGNILGVTMDKKQEVKGDIKNE